MATELLFDARIVLEVDDLVLWVRSGGALITEATTVTGGRGSSVDIPLGQGIAGRAFASHAVVIVPDFHDTASLERRQLVMQQPDVVAREGWRSAIYVPLPYPPSLAVIAAYSERRHYFDSRRLEKELELWGERALLRARWDHVSARPLRLAFIYDNLSNHLHDIRQYADTALMNVEGLRDGATRASVNRSVDSLKNLRELCEKDLRSVAFANPRSRLCNVSEIVADLVEYMQQPAAARRIKIVLSAEQRAPGLIDATVLRRAIANLITNSITQLTALHRDNKKIWVTVSKQELHTTIEVRDNGPGIQPDRVTRIFEPGVSYSSNGFGLGLSQVEAAMSAAGGAVQITANDFGNGCAFTLYLPIRGR